MTFIRILIITLLFSFIFIKVHCQENLSIHSPITIKSTTLDTIKLTDKIKIIDVLWLNDTIRVSVSNQEVKTDTSVVKNVNNKGYFASRGFIFSDESVIQNCFSYALEKYFENSETYNQNIFRKTTNIDGESIEKILSNSFVKITEFTTKPRKNLKQTIPNDVILAFVNGFGSVIHTVYYRNEKFYTKNGMFKPDTFKSLNKFIQKTYWDTKKIIVYRIDEDKIKST